MKTLAWNTGLSLVTCAVGGALAIVLVRYGVPPWLASMVGTGVYVGGLMGGAR